jgi:CO/xanthine dehydrogenase Mo-binding subunit
MTALTQIVAEKFDLPRSHVAVIQGDTAPTSYQGTTFRNFSVQNGGG